MKKAMIIAAVLLAVLCLAACANDCAVYDLPASAGAPRPGEASVPPARKTQEAEGSALPSEPAKSEPAEPTGAPPSELPTDDLLVLVNFENPIYEEPPVVLICDHLTAGNVYCDPRRHADERAVEALNEMFLAAEREGDFHFIVSSAFRAIWEQRVLWENKLAESPGYGGDPYNDPVKVMPPNCSEHVTGLAFDILSESCPHSDANFAATGEGLWLAENAHRFGFILRYPRDKQHVTGVQYEPWHFRYVGVAAAERIHRQGVCLEEYLGRVHN